LEVLGYRFSIHLSLFGLISDGSARGSQNSLDRHFLLSKLPFFSLLTMTQTGGNKRIWQVAIHHFSLR